MIKKKYLHPTLMFVMIIIFPDIAHDELVALTMVLITTNGLK